MPVRQGLARLSGLEGAAESSIRSVSARLAERGYRVTEVDLLPFIMSGGSAYCMTLRLDRCSIEVDALRLAAE
jgi:hypothetical protein